MEQARSIGTVSMEIQEKLKYIYLGLWRHIHRLVENVISFVHTLSPFCVIETGSVRSVVTRMRIAIQELK